MHTLGRDRAWIYSHPESAIAADDLERYFALIARRAAGEPAQHHRKAGILRARIRSESERLDSSPGNGACG